MANLTVAQKTVYAVLLYPPHGRPRVSEVPKPPFKGMLQTFPTRAKAEAALEKFLTENPEYRNWIDGSIKVK